MTAPNQARQGALCLFDALKGIANTVADEAQL
jgi:hypothetical protein